ncbi:sulfite exporter TauE/SafE family protein [bacterium]|nr:sulfite exporter TauE/SafE family protein [bacterium]
MGDESQVTIFVSFAAGLVSFLSPCVLPLIPTYVAFITGFSLNELQDSHKDSAMLKKMIINSLAFILGFSTIFILLGASASFIGQFLNEYKTVISKIGGFVIIFLGLFMTGLFKVQSLLQEKKFHISKKPLGLIGTFLVGVTFAAGWTPCVGPILGSVLVVAGSSGHFLKGIILLTAYSLGLGIPFFISTLAIGWLLSFNKKIMKYVNIISVLGGIFLIIIGLLMVTGKFNMLIYSFSY